MHNLKKKCNFAVKIQVRNISRYHDTTIIPLKKSHIYNKEIFSFCECSLIETLKAVTFVSSSCYYIS